MDKAFQAGSSYSTDLSTPQISLLHSFPLWMDKAFWQSCILLTLGMESFIPNRRLPHIAASVRLTKPIRVYDQPAFSLNAVAICLCFGDGQDWNLHVFLFFGFSFFANALRFGLTSDSQ